MLMDVNVSKGIRVVIAETTRMAGRLLADALGQQGVCDAVATSQAAETMSVIAGVRPAVVLVGR
jgi:hypothetical protein